MDVCCIHAFSLYQCNHGNKYYLCSIILTNVDCTFVYFPLEKYLTKACHMHCFLIYENLQNSSNIYNNINENWMTSVNVFSKYILDFLYQYSPSTTQLNHILSPNYFLFQIRRKPFIRSFYF